MKIFSWLYVRALAWSAHPRAPWYLGGLSFAESSFFPIPPDVMLAPMCLARRDRAWQLALLTTVASVAGGMLGYVLGLFAFDLIEPWLRGSERLWSSFELAQAWFDRYGFWAVFLAGFSPIPYKVFTVGAGTIGMAFLPFLIASIIGRGARFYLVAGLIRFGGERMEAMLRRHVDTMGWALVAVVVLVLAVLELSRGAGA